MGTLATGDAGQACPLKGKPLREPAEMLDYTLLQRGTTFQELGVLSRLDCFGFEGLFQNKGAFPLSSTGQMWNLMWNKTTELRSHRRGWLKSI